LLCNAQNRPAHRIRRPSLRSPRCRAQSGVECGSSAALWVFRRPIPSGTLIAAAAGRASRVRALHHALPGAICAHGHSALSAHRAAAEQAARTQNSASESVRLLHVTPDGRGQRRRCRVQNQQLGMRTVGRRRGMRRLSACVDRTAPPASRGGLRRTLRRRVPCAWRCLRKRGSMPPAQRSTRMHGCRYACVTWRGRANSSRRGGVGTSRTPRLPGPTGEPAAAHASVGEEVGQPTGPLRRPAAYAPMPRGMPSAPR